MSKYLDKGLRQANRVSLDAICRDLAALRAGDTGAGQRVWLAHEYLIWQSAIAHRNRLPSGKPVPKFCRIEKRELIGVLSDILTTCVDRLSRKDVPAEDVERYILADMKWAYTRCLRETSPLGRRTSRTPASLDGDPPPSGGRQAPPPPATYLGGDRPSPIDDASHDEPYRKKRGRFYKPDRCKNGQRAEKAVRWRDELLSLLRYTDDPSGIQTQILVWAFHGWDTSDIARRLGLARDVDVGPLVKQCYVRRGRHRARLRRLSIQPPEGWTLDDLAAAAESIGLLGDKYQPERRAA